MRPKLRHRYRRRGFWRPFPRMRQQWRLQCRRRLRSPKPAIPAEDKVDPETSFLIHLSLNFFAMTLYHPQHSGKMDILHTLQMQDLPHFSGRSDFKGEFLKNPAYLSHLFSIARRLDAR